MENVDQLIEHLATLTLINDVVWKDATMTWGSGYRYECTYNNCEIAYYTDAINKYIKIDDNEEFVVNDNTNPSLLFIIRAQIDNNEQHRIKTIINKVFDKKEDDEKKKDIYISFLKNYIC